MFNHIKIQSLDDFFLQLGRRPSGGVYFYRINGFSQEIVQFIRAYYEAARKSGVILEGKIPNPDEKNLSYYNEIMGMDFAMSAEFISSSLQKWLPRMNAAQREQTAASLYDTLDALRRAGKTEHMLKNAYIKFMCWLYYKFERIVNQLGAQDVPKILYEGDVGSYELMLLSILSNAGCDVVLLQYHGDANYRKLDAQQRLSDELKRPGMTDFPETFCLKRLREELQNEINKERLYGKRPQFLNCTNAWIETGERNQNAGMQAGNRNQNTGMQAGDRNQNAGMQTGDRNQSAGEMGNEIGAGSRAEIRAGAENRTGMEIGTGMETGNRGLCDIKKNPSQRGNDPHLFYNCYCRINGVWDKAAYANELYQFHLELKNSGRRIVIVNESIARPQPDEISAIHRNNYERTDQMLMDLSTNIRYTANIELQRIMVKAFIDVILMEEKKLMEENAMMGQKMPMGQKAVMGQEAAVGQKAAGRILNKLTNRAVYLLCWLKRYQGGLFSNWKAPDIGCFIYMGGCRDENEALFLRFLARIPADVLILCPNLTRKCCLTDRLLYEVHYEISLDMHAFPQENRDVHIGTAAYHAQRELDTLLYQDSGLYRDRQYAKANAVILQTMYEEIQILWNQEVKYRPNFSTLDGVVNIPVLAAKVSGVKDGQVSQYWRFIRELITEDTFVIKKAPFLEPSAPNPMRAYAAQFYKNGRLDKAGIKRHAAYPYGFLREEIQDYLLEKLQILIDLKAIRGTFENGTEYTIISTVLNLPKELVRLIQKFDFTKKNPKLIYIHADETMISLEDTILAAFLSLAGFDVLFFVPTGYQNIEKYFNKKMLEEHQAGEYMYDLRVPNMESLSPNGRTKWRDKIFKRGR